MVTLASSTIRVIVRELGGPEPVKTYDIVADYGAVGDGVTGNKEEFDQFKTDHENTAGKVRLFVPEGNFYIDSVATTGYDFTNGFENLHVLGEPPVDGVWPSQVERSFAVGAYGGVYQTNTTSARIEPAAQGATVLTVKDRDITGTGRTLAQIMALFEVGKWIMISEYDTQGYGYPQNPIFSEFRQIVSKTTNTITISEGLSRAYSDTPPEFNTGEAPYSPDFGGPATIYQTYPEFLFTNVVVENIQFNNDVPIDGNYIQVYPAGNQIVMKNCKVMREIAPTAAKSITIQGGEFNDFEFDKLIDYFEADGVTAAAFFFQSSQPAVAVVRNSTISALVGTPRNFTMEDSTITGAATVGPAFFGLSESATFDNVVFPADGISNGTLRSHSIAGCIIDGGTVSGYQITLLPLVTLSGRTGTPTIGQTLTGPSGTATILDVALPYLAVSVTSGSFAVNDAVTTPTMTATYAAYSNGTLTVGETFTGNISGETGVLASGLTAVARVNFDAATLSGPFTYGEIVTSASGRGFIASGNNFGMEWACAGQLVFFGGSGSPDPFFVCGATITDYYRDGDLISFETDLTAFPSYTDSPINSAYINPCPALTLTNCTGGDPAVALNGAGTRPFGSYVKQWLTSGGVLSNRPRFFGKFVSLTVTVTRAYTGTEPTLCWGMLDLVGIRLDGVGGGAFTNTNPPRFRVLVDLKTTGTRVFTPSGATGLVGADIGDDDGYHFIFEGTSFGTLCNTAGTTKVISGESSSVWPAFTVTMITEV